MFPPHHLRAQRLKPIKYDDMTGMMYNIPPKKKQRSNSTGAANTTNFTICLKYSGILFQGFASESEMVVVEEPWMGILEELPDALARRVYGT